MLPSPSPTPNHLPTALSSLDWTALSATGTLIAGVGTLMAVVVSLHTLNHQVRREADLHRREFLQQRQAQASYISVWYDEFEEAAQVENRSEQPIYDVGVTLRRALPAPGEPSHLPLHVGGICPVLPPHHRVLVPLREQLANPVPLLAFRDAYGVIWQRDDQGTLTELSVDVRAHYGVHPEAEFATGTIPRPL